MARKNILSPGTMGTAGLGARPTPPKPAQPRGPVGALQSSLSRMQENTVQDIDPALIDDAGVEDRLGDDYHSDRDLVESLRTYGQQVPVLLRPHPSNPRRYEIVYGRRRLRALKELGQPVKAMVRQLDDHALVLAQGQENTARRDLSFIEKASFAAQLQALDYDRQTIAAALSIDLPMVSRMLKVGTAFDLDMLRRIGSAPGIGRDRWMTLVNAMKQDKARSRVHLVMNLPKFAHGNSDARFEMVLEAAQNKAPRPKAATPEPRALTRADGAPLGEVKQTAKATTLVIPRDADGFGDWLAENAEAIARDLHDRWQETTAED